MVPSTNATNAPSHPFPDLDSLMGLKLPLYDLNEMQQADPNVFTSEFGYIGQTNSSIRTCTITFSTFAALFLVCGIVALVTTKLSKPDSDTERRSE